jgi:succinate dehydrogenase / fumarate reductase cytochrome b subunit
MVLKYAYHPGNVAHSGSPEINETMMPLAHTLGIKLTPLDGATSCGAGIIRQANHRLQLALNARIFAQAEALGLEIMTPCAATAGNLSEDLATLRSNPILLEEINEILQQTSGLTFSGGTEVHHLLHVIVDEFGLDKLSNFVKNRVDFSIAGYYGPNMQQSGACGGDDVFDPNYFEQLISALGGTPVEWESRTQSVGVPGLFSEELTVLRQAAAVLSDARSEGADMIVSACNLSHSILDIYQGKASRVTGIQTNIPVVHLCEILSFALGHHTDRFAQLRTRIAVIGD